MHAKTAGYRSGAAPTSARPSTEKPSEPQQSREVLPAGTKVGRYEVVRLLGEGGMGTVYEAMDVRLGRKVALKILSASLKGKRKAAKRFEIEARAAARLRHPNVVAIYDFDVDCESPYMAMEFLQGETLAAAIARGPLPFDRLADIMMAVCAGVSAAHDAGIVHRDLKPSNIFLCCDWNGNQTARVLDFGISKVGGICLSELTQTGDIVGTSQYMSPEQASGGRNVSYLSDQYSLGVVMYECVTQETPHRGQPIYTLLRNIAEGRHTPPRQLREDLPSALEAVIERAMKVRPKDRFSSVNELAGALFSFASLEGKHRFADFCGPGRALTPSAGSVPSLPLPSSSASLLAPTEPLPSEQPRPWQRQDTRTSLRPTGKTRRSRSQNVDVGGPDPGTGPGLARKMIVSIALGAALAAATLLVIGLFLHL
jgi:eukaryotic-like serine/threonine-protein kinase